MTVEEYKKLNDCLNECFIRLEENDWFLLKNLKSFDKISKSFIEIVNEYDLDLNINSDYISFDDIYTLTREIITDISSSFLPIFDTIIESGELDFSYEGEYNTSHFVYSRSKGVSLININRINTYEDIIVLIHEFMHKVSYSNALNRYFFSEFISIYFEEYARKKLLKKGISKNSLNSQNKRIAYTLKIAKDFISYSRIIFAYEKMGKIDMNSYEFLDEYFTPTDKDDFGDECKVFLQKIQKIENSYKMSILYEKDFNENELYDKIIRSLSKGYRYILGTAVAYYALEHCNKEDIVYLSWHINDEEFRNISFFECLNKIGISSDIITINDCTDAVKKVLENNSHKKDR